MTLGEFIKWLKLCGYPQKFLGGGGVGLKSTGVLTQSAVRASVTGTTAKTVLATIPVPANVIGKNGALRISMFWTLTNNANNKTPGIDFGGTKFWAPTTNGALTVASQISIMNRNSQSSQIANPGISGYATSGGAFNLGSVDTTQQQTLTISMTLAVQTDTATLEAYTVEVLNP